MTPHHQIYDYKSHDTVQALTELLHRAQRGHLRGFMFAYQSGALRHRIGITGDYWADPAQALNCAVKLTYRINRLVEDREVHAPAAPDTSLGDL